MSIRFSLFSGSPCARVGDAESAVVIGPSHRLLLLVALREAAEDGLPRAAAKQLLYGHAADGSRRLTGVLQDLRRRDHVSVVTVDDRLILETSSGSDLDDARRFAAEGRHSEVAALISARCRTHWAGALEPRGERLLARLDDDADATLRPSLARQLKELAAGGKSAQARKLLANHLFYSEDVEVLATFDSMLNEVESQSHSIPSNENEEISSLPVSGPTPGEPAAAASYPSDTKRRRSRMAGGITIAIAAVALTVSTAAVRASLRNLVVSEEAPLVIGDVLGEDGAVTTLEWHPTRQQLTLGQSHALAQRDEWFMASHRFAPVVADWATGDWIAVSGADGRGSGLDLREVHADGTAEVIGHAPGDDMHPAPSPDGRWIAFASERWSAPGAYRIGIALLDRSTGTVRRLAADSLASYMNPVWSANGEWLAYARVDADRSAASSLCVFTIRDEESRCYTGPTKDVQTLGWDSDSTILIRGQPGEGGERFFRVLASSGAFSPSVRSPTPFGGCQYASRIRGVLCGRADSLFVAFVDASPTWTAVGRVPRFDGSIGTGVRLFSPATVVGSSVATPLRALSRWSVFGLPSPRLPGRGDSVLLLNGDATFWTEVVSTGTWPAESPIDIWLDVRVPVTQPKWQRLRVALVAASELDSVSMSSGTGVDVDPLTLLPTSAIACQLELPAGREPRAANRVALDGGGASDSATVAPLKERWIAVHLGWRPTTGCSALVAGATLAVPRRMGGGSMRLVLAGQSVATSVAVKNVRASSGGALR